MCLPTGDDRCLPRGDTGNGRREIRGEGVGVEGQDARKQGCKFPTLVGCPTF